MASAADWERVRSLYEEAQELPQSRRTVFLRDAISSAPELRALIDPLLRSEQPPDAFLEPPGSSVLDALRRADTPNLEVGGDFAGYRVEAVVGSGATSIVYRASQKQPRRTVALKVLRGAALSKRLLRRFEHESDLMARLKHPHIAQVFEAGTGETPLGPQPFIAMQLIEGKSITEHVRGAGLSRAARLELFGAVCSAVHHAHQRGIVHRDIKPDNILIEPDGTPKVLDFGVARVVAGDAPLTLVTQPGELIGTVPYMSPEQAAGRVDEIDVRSDVYSLGVILYELLTGTLPYPVADTGLAEAARMIAEQVPVSPGSLCRELRGDLSTVILKALQKEPEQRYASVGALSDDLERVLRNEPVQARPPSARYQLLKLATRHKAQFVLGSLLLVAVILFATVATVQAVRISVERDNAVAAQNREAEARRQAERVSDFFLVDLFEVTDPQKANVEQLTARDVLDRGAQRIREGFEGQPETRATLMLSMGRVYEQLGLLPSARELMESALELRRGLFAEESTDVADVKFHLAGVLDGLGEPDAAERLHVEALETRRNLLGPQDLLVAGCLRELGGLLTSRGAYTEALEHVEEALAIYKRHSGPESEGVAWCITGLARIRCRQGEHEEAERLQRESLTMYERIHGETHPVVAQALSDLGWILQNRTRNREAIPVLERAIRIRRQVSGAESLGMAGDLYLLGKSYNWYSRLDESEAAWREALAIRRRLVGNDTPSVAQLLEEIALKCLGKRYDYDEAAPLMREALDIRRRLYDEPTEQFAFGLCSSAQVFLNALDYEEADRVSREGYELIQEIAEEKSVFRIYSGTLRGRTLVRLGRYDEAEELMRVSLREFEALVGAAHVGVAQVRSSLAALLLERGQYEEAERLIREALEVFEVRSGGHDRRMGFDKLGQILAAQGDYVGALDAYEKALDPKRYGDEKPAKALTLHHLAELHHALLEFEEAERLYEESISMYLRSLKPAYPEVAAARVGRAKLRMHMGELDQAESDLRAVLEDQIGATGEAHPLVARTQCLLGTCLLTKGESYEGERMFQSAFERLRAAYPPHHHFVREAATLAGRFVTDEP